METYRSNSNDFDILVLNWPHIGLLEQLLLTISRGRANVQFVQCHVLVFILNTDNIWNVRYVYSSKNFIQKEYI